ncbi:uncharacterized protein ACA1_385600 [Acanthamoeba castellanii str. Neff]|uniref:Uncharacterized protein n=1 Tax=Acanthamoeba castellanii (strain ATCC 30010 / Neff) TaxID=1257118 RepID=L8HAN4_ACACF|nr:uncharacterized protein ACA1_385600 [Acanthamoeba castellanii str. Neff]ELR21783.1 hypothetical protein ACA1_385600 [Acanthamoeba castellanii str. Neff]
MSLSNAARKLKELNERGSVYKQLTRDEVALLTPELSPAIMMRKLIAKHGHAEVFRRHGPTARRLEPVDPCPRILRARTRGGVDATLLPGGAAGHGKRLPAQVPGPCRRPVHRAFELAKEELHRPSAGLARNQFAYAYFSLSVQTSVLLGHYLFTKGGRAQGSTEQIIAARTAASSS